MIDIEEVLSFGLDLADAAEKQIMPRYQNCSVSMKPDGTEVTEADQAAEFAMRAIISREFPSHGVLGEEFGATGLERSQFTWVLDPIDGTAWFALGLPVFGTLIAFCERNEPLLGIIHFPALHETVYAARNIGCWFRAGSLAPVRLHVAEGVALRNAVVCSSGPQSSNIGPEPGFPPYNLKKVIAKSKRFKFGGDCIQHALVCKGKINAAIDMVMHPWDIAAIVPCIEEAGGVVTSLDGVRSSVLYGGNLLTSCSEEIHEELLIALTPEVPLLLSSVNSAVANVYPLSEKRVV